MSFICSLLIGRALDWATVVWEAERMSFPLFTCFLHCFREAFEHSAGKKEAEEQLLARHQGGNTAADYALSFRTLAAQTGWLDDPLKLLYRKGLTSELQSELACHDEGKTLDQFIDLSIRIDNLIRSQRAPRYAAVHSPAAAVFPEPDPVQVGFTHLTSEERERCVRNHLCLYCGQPGHLRASCPTCPSVQNSSTVSSNSRSLTTLEIPVTLMFNGKCIDTMALIDSGAAGNVVDIKFVNSHNYPISHLKYQ